MLTLAPRMSVIKPSPITQVAGKVRELKAAGNEVISFSIGVPGFLPPEHVYAAAHAAADNDSGDYLPGRGIPALVQAFQSRLDLDGFAYKEEEICAAMGGKNALFNLFQVLTGVGDEVIFPAPYWSSYWDMVLLSGATPKDVRCGADQHYKMTPEQLEAAITDNTKVFLFNNPSNPTGMVYTEDEVRALGDVLMQHPDVWIISDDIYDKLIYDGKKFHHLLHTHPQLRDRTAIVQSVSKSYGMPGWRVGMVAGPKRLIDGLLTLVSQSLMNVPGITMAGAAAAFGGDHSFLTGVKNDFVQKRDLTMAALGQVEGLICPQPEGAFYAFPDVSSTFGKAAGNTQITDDIAFCTALLEQENVALVPGSAFGEANAVRISYACDEANLQEGLRRIQRFIANLS